MNKFSIALLSVLGILFGLIFDLYLVNETENIEKLDYLLFTVSILIIVDTIFRESFRMTIIPYFVDSKNYKEYIVSNSLTLIMVCAFVFILSFLFNVDSLIYKILMIFLYIVSSCIMALYQSLMIAKGKIVIANFRNMILYCFCILYLNSIASITEKNIVLSYLFSNFLFVLLCCFFVKLGGSKVGLANISSNFIHLNHCLFSGFLNVAVGQIYRFSERTILLSMSAGVISIYYLSFKIFASFQQVIATNILSYFIKDVLERDVDILLKIKKFFILVTMSCFLLMALAYFFNVANLITLIMGNSVNPETLFFNTFILFFALFYQMMLPVNLQLIYLENKQKTWFLYYSLSSIISLTFFFLVSNFEMIYLVSVVSVINIVSSYYISKYLSEKHE